MLLRQLALRDRDEAGEGAPRTRADRRSSRRAGARRRCTRSRGGDASSRRGTRSPCARAPGICAAIALIVSMRSFARALAASASSVNSSSCLRFSAVRSRCAQALEVRAELRHQVRKLAQRGDRRQRRQLGERLLEVVQLQPRGEQDQLVERRLALHVERFDPHPRLVDDERDIGGVVAVRNLDRGGGDRRREPFEPPSRGRGAHRPGVVGGVEVAREARRPPTERGGASESISRRAASIMPANRRRSTIRSSGRPMNPARSVSR